MIINRLQLQCAGNVQAGNTTGSNIVFHKQEFVNQKFWVDVFVDTLVS